MNNQIHIRGRYSFLTAAGIITGTVMEMDSVNKTYYLENVIIRSSLVQNDLIKFCHISEQQIVAFTAAIDAPLQHK